MFYYLIPSTQEGQFLLLTRTGGLAGGRDEGRTGTLAQVRIAVRQLRAAGGSRVPGLPFMVHGSPCTAPPGTRPLPRAPHKRVVTIRKPRKDDAGEWCVAVLVDGARCEARCYYTDDRSDAFGTYRAMVQETALA